MFYFNNIIKTFLLLSSAAQLHLWTHIIPEGTESVNGSRVDGGCKGNLTLGFCGANIESFLIDGVNPVINTTNSNWASELVTVRKKKHSLLPCCFVFLVSITYIIDINQTEPLQVSSVGHWSSKHHCVCRYG